MAQKKSSTCPTCMGKGVIEGVCETSPEWDGAANEQSDGGRICTPDDKCPTCKGTGKVEG
ncbi:MAG: ankyrin [Desulfobulbaceae bacterium]|nr:ankyrin [Desulfobulbaceae bacterium]